MVGKLLREKMRDDARETPARADERRRLRKIGEQVEHERLERYPVLTADNAQEAMDWQAARLAELAKG